MPVSLAHPFRTARAYVPYPAGVALARRLAGNALARRRFFSRDIRLIKDVYEDACGIRLDDRAVHKLLTAKALKRWRIFDNLIFSDPELERHVRISGLDKVRDLNQSGQCVVLASAHYIAAGCVVPVLARLGFDVHGLKRRRFGNPYFSQTPYIYADGENALDGIEKLYRVMKSGGLIHTLIDGGQGTGVVSLPFFGRVCNFRRSLIELAWTEGAAIVPVSVRTDIDGRILIDFHEPLSVEERGLPKKVVTAGIVERHAAFLEATIRTYPWCFDPARIEHFWHRTTVDEANAGRPGAAF